MRIKKSYLLNDILKIKSSSTIEVIIELRSDVCIIHVPNKFVQYLVKEKYEQTIKKRLQPRKIGYKIFSDAKKTSAFNTWNGRLLKFLLNQSTSDRVSVAFEKLLFLLVDKEFVSRIKEVRKKWNILKSPTTKDELHKIYQLVDKLREKRHILYPFYQWVKQLDDINYIRTIPKEYVNIIMRLWENKTILAKQISYDPSDPWYMEIRSILEDFNLPAQFFNAIEFIVMAGSLTPSSLEYLHKGTESIKRKTRRDFLIRYLYFFNDIHDLNRIKSILNEHGFNIPKDNLKVIITRLKKTVT